ncbi:Stp1/IreP family PP2C-type Ser/Thr phosphatase [Vallitalea pronyensis]|uniref:Stp1/IreP family PP2C-type Ser/Thr phosphatase n=1 Tax=Vallitalea pronyensis TaxID=1348613 RepID=A0A8J8MJW9_9FIRM|nr:Stp1/IreP family PP2C-type Ser/Thr phosphatase [Vallitalea pronyensis]QUI22924.1 Stp1/IreP family PP2C-type Ser/Thr phosphatase [Vallitalea pronyensis]
MKAIGRTHKGKIRSINQDSFYISNEAVGNLPNLYIIADGMGGHKAGEYASLCAVEEFLNYTKTHHHEHVKDAFTSGIHYINDFIYKKSLSNESYHGMGTTFIVSSIKDNCLHVANVGDSRLYLINDTIAQITEDHSLVEEMIKCGELTRGEERNHPNKNIITRAVGVDEHVECDIFTLNVSNDEFILMCSDGLTNMLEDDKILRVVESNQTLEDKLDELIELALNNGGTDNIAAVLIKGE